MEKLLKEHETLFTIVLIMIYVIVNSYIMQNFGTSSYQSVIINTTLSILLVLLVILLKRVEFYGITNPNHTEKFIYFIPLFIISLFNLRRGIHINNSTSEMIFHILTMINIGFLEEMLFRGFLFKMMAKDNIQSAIIVSSITFGIGHIVNLLNGAELVQTLLQVCYAIAIGYMLVMIFYKSKSIIPCIIFHAVFNSLTIFATGSSNIIDSVILIAMCLVYTLYINKKIKA
ncbi:MAG: CPBP family intramembrane metalloprotease [Bacilli bacterium]|nr:CPBP family intramembrane metalloprotease [Bacilli bacterium]